MSPSERQEEFRHQISNAETVREFVKPGSIVRLLRTPNGDMYLRGVAADENGAEISRFAGGTSVLRKLGEDKRGNDYILRWAEQTQNMIEALLSAREECIKEKIKIEQEEALKALYRHRRGQLDDAKSNGILTQDEWSAKVASLEAEFKKPVQAKPQETKPDQSKVNA